MGKYGKYRVRKAALPASPGAQRDPARYRHWSEGCDAFVGVVLDQRQELTSSAFIHDGGRGFRYTALFAVRLVGNLLGEWS